MEFLRNLAPLIKLRVVNNSWSLASTLFIYLFVYSFVIYIVTLFERATSTSVSTNSSMRFAVRSLWLRASTEFARANKVSEAIQMYMRVQRPSQSNFHEFLHSCSSSG